MESQGDLPGQLQGHAQKWLAAWPEQRFVALFLPPPQRAPALAFGALVHELALAAYHVREPQVAEAKLAWWRDELERAADGRASHPLTQALFAAATRRLGDAAAWPALAVGALTQRDMPPAITFDELYEQHAPFHLAVARVAAGLFGDGRADTDIGGDAVLYTSAHLLHGLPWLDAEGLPLPLDLLARHGLARAQLGEASPARVVLLGDFLGGIERRIDRALAVPAARPLALRVRARLDVALARRARGAADPLAWLAQHAQAGAWRSLWTAWREARAGLRR